MSITPAQRFAAEQRQFLAAQDPAPRVRLVAGPGTGKSKTIEKRVAHVLNSGAIPQNVYVISFTVAASAELRERIETYCANLPCAAAAALVRVSTMHSLALRILRSANLLTTLYPADPTVLDDWERKHIYDIELASTLACRPGRAEEIRLAHDAAWQTLNPHFVNQAAITPVEVQGFNVFHAARGNLYCCVLPGEVVFKCVDAIKLGQIQAAQLPQVDHLIVDEFQDLNACDQQFVSYLSNRGGILFVAGDDDQSIYSFRHADPTGIVQFTVRYQGASPHELVDCFRCTPSILAPAIRMIAFNPGRLPKNPVSLYLNAQPPVIGTLQVWSFATQQDEAEAIAQSCEQLIRSGLRGEEDQILILISDRGLQLNAIAQALGNLGLPYDPPPGEDLLENDGIRAVNCLIRIANDISTATPDYVAHRALLGLLAGVGPVTAKNVGDLCMLHNQNFHNLFYLPAMPNWLIGRALNAVNRLIAIIQSLQVWSLTDTIAARQQEIAQTLQTIFQGSNQAGNHLATWMTLSGSLPADMTMQELSAFFSADTDSDRQAVLELVNKRLGVVALQPPAQPKRIRILTMHGAKGLSGKVVFIPSVEQGIMPSFRALQAAGLVIEQRRLFYVSVTRAMAACIISHATLHTGAAAFRLRQQPNVMLPRSEFLNQMGEPSVNRITGLTTVEAAQIVADIHNL
jgi:DNA helicase II / ATP-dependent DNA helicase PcrA